MDQLSQTSLCQNEGYIFKIKIGKLTFPLKRKKIGDYETLQCLNDKSKNF